MTSVVRLFIYNFYRKLFIIFSIRPFNPLNDKIPQKSFLSSETFQIQYYYISIGGINMTSRKRHPLYQTWKNMKDRCYCKTNRNYKYYGGRGVIVDERWHDFDNFVYDIDNQIPNGHLLYNRDYQLDKDKLGRKIYSLENCSVISTEENRKMAYRKQQKRIVAMNENEEITFQSISEASRNLNIPRNTIQYYLKNGMRHPIGYQFKYCC